MTQFYTSTGKGTAFNDQTSKDMPEIRKNKLLLPVLNYLIVSIDFLLVMETARVVPFDLKKIEEAHTWSFIESIFQILVRTYIAKNN